MMLFYKAWRESQARLLVSAGALGWFCAVFIVFRSVRDSAARSYAQFVLDSIYAGQIRLLFVMFVITFGMGGLLQERARATASFTLALPVGRTRHVATRALVGFAEVFALALAPTTAVLVLSPFVHQTYPMAEALRYSTQWAAAGSVIFAAAFLLSVCLAGAYAALGASVITIVAYGLALNTPFGRAHPAANLFELMESPRLPIVALAGCIVVAFAIVGASAWATERQDFA